MSGNLTFAMIKPDASAMNVVGEILDKIEKAGFRIVAIKKTKLSVSDVSKFYVEHIGKDFFEDLEVFISSGPVYPMVLEKENAVAEFRKILGSTDPTKAEDGTIRKKFATAKNRNTCHGADSDENALRELGFFFNKLELL
jgi:nucleoside-diphosphate kinase